MASSVGDAELVKEAAKLRELFKGRFSDKESLELLKTHGDLSDAVDFVLKGDPAEVRQFINDRNKVLVDNLRRDSAYVQQALVEGLEASVRLFGCRPCNRYWWRKVPARKEVSRCKVCKVKYDAVPREHEWGLAEFVCDCGHVFWGSGQMNHLKSPCYKCGKPVSPKSIKPPARNRPRNQKMLMHHSCTGANCYNRDDRIPSYGLGAPALYNAPGGGTGGGGGGRGRSRRGAARGGGDLAMGGGGGMAVGGGGRYGGGRRGGGGAMGYEPGFDDDGLYYHQHHHNDDDSEICPHPRSTGTKVLYPSNPHVSTGSTVNTFMTQGEILELYDDLPSLPDVIEDVED